MSLNQTLDFHKQMNPFTWEKKPPHPLFSSLTFSFPLIHSILMFFYRATKSVNLSWFNLTGNALAQTSHSSLQKCFVSFFRFSGLSFFLFHTARGQPYAPNPILLGTNTKTISAQHDRERLKGGKVFGVNEI